MYAAPFAQSITIFNPSSLSEEGIFDFKYSMYLPPASSILFALPIFSDFTKGKLLLSINFSSSISCSSDNFVPSGQNILIPLSIYSLCEADIITPTSQRFEVTKDATPGVGRGPVK